MKTPDTLIASFEDEAPAAMLGERLQRFGIATKVANESSLQRLVFWAKPHAAKQLFVPAEDFEPAKALIQRLDTEEHLLSEAIHCPSCGSPRVEYPQYTKKFIMPLLIEWMISLGFAEKDYYCTDCHFTWPNKEKAPENLDALGFPKKEPPRSKNGEGPAPR